LADSIEHAASAEGFAACAALLARTSAVSEANGDAQMLDAPSRGCAHDGLHRSRTGVELYAYAAVLVLEPGPVLLTGMVRPDLREQWAPRFQLAAASLRHLRQPSP